MNPWWSWLTGAKALPPPPPPPPPPSVIAGYIAAAGSSVVGDALSWISSKGFVAVVVALVLGIAVAVALLRSFVINTKQVLEHTWTCIKWISFGVASTVLTYSVWHVLDHFGVDKAVRGLFAR